MNCWRKNLIQTIATKCAEREVTVSKDLISFLLTLCELNPLCRVDENDESGNEEAIRIVTEKLIAQSSPSLVTLKIQLYFAKHYSNRDETIKKHRLRLHKKTGPLVAEICETTHLDNDRDIERLYQKILVVVTLLSGLGNPMIASVLKLKKIRPHQGKSTKQFSQHQAQSEKIKNCAQDEMALKKNICQKEQKFVEEVAVALQSVYQPTELTNYVTLTRQEKEEQLMELMCIVAGIRLFNRDCQRGGEGIDDLPEILHDAVGKSRDAILELLEELMKTVYRLTAAVERIVEIPIDDDDEALGSAKTVQRDERTNEQDFAWAIELLTACRQQEIYIRKLLADLETCENEIKLLMERLQGRLFKLHDTVRYRTAIPTLQVYPQFIDLADIWMRLQDEVIVLSHINSFLWQLRVLCTKNVNIHDHTKLDGILQDREILTDAERLEQSMGRLISNCGDCLIIYPNNTKDFEQINLQFLGFCAWTFVTGRGSLIPGNPNIGVLKWRAKYFAFSSAEAARKFGEDPNRFVYAALDFVRRRPEYVYLFQLYNDIEAMKSRKEISDEDSHLKIQKDQGVQTDLHVLPAHIDREYSHSIWEYRRRALRLATIAQCETRSTQTAKSHFRNGVYVQAALPKDRGVQTRRDAQANTMKLKTYIFGLRGNRDSIEPHVLSFADDELFARLE